MAIGADPWLRQAAVPGAHDQPVRVPGAVLVALKGWLKPVSLWPDLCTPAAVPYVPNHERIELGLEGYGSDVPQDVLKEAIARREKLLVDRSTLLDVGPSQRKRARNKKGQLVADDPTTPDKNEAFEEG